MSAKSRNRDDYQTVPRRIGAMSRSFPDAYLNDWHTHPRAQLVYGVAGIMEMRTPDGVWVLSPLRALWVPAGVRHRMRAHGPVELRTLFIQQGEKDHDIMPRSECVIPVSPLLKELILRATELPVEYDEAGPEGKVMDLILSEIKPSTAGRLYLPTLEDERLKRLEALLRRDMSDNRNLEAWAGELHVSGKTLNRLIRKETGTGFSTWRQSLRVHLALLRLAAGGPITSVALDVGYATPSAFTRMFRRVMGVTPREYLKQLD